MNKELIDQAMEELPRATPRELFRLLLELEDLECFRKILQDDPYVNELCRICDAKAIAILSAFCKNLR